MALLKMNSPKVVIIGAGIAGLSAAARLYDKGIKDIVILEAAERIGGRIQTTHFGDGWVELGAQWIHGHDDNAAYNFASKYDLVSKAGEFELQDDVFCSEDGTAIDRSLAESVYEGVIEKLENCHQHCSESDGRLTVDAYFDKIFAEDIAKSKSLEEFYQKKALLDWCKYFQCSIEGCDTLADLKLKSVMEYHLCPGNILTNLKRGYTSLVSKMASKFPSTVIHLRKRVIKVRLANPVTRGQMSVVIRCQDGSEYAAEHVVVTSSLGYLKQHATTMFTPPLPSSKLDVIQKLGFGTVDKIFLEFERPFWPPNCSGYSLVWKHDFGSGAPDPSKPYYKAIFGFYTIPFASNVLCGWIGGAAARHMESLPDEEVKDTCLSLLHRFTGKADLPTVKSLVRSSWQSNPFARGSYSFYTKEDCSNSTLAEPIYVTMDQFPHPAVLFAGEATHSHYFSTVHGAMETGYREADRIVEYYTLKQLTHKL